MTEDDIEWVSRTAHMISDDPADITVNIPEAHALVVAADEILVIVFPTWLTPMELDMHRARLKEGLGNRFILMAGDHVQLAKVKNHDWADTPAITWKGEQQ